MRAAKDEIRRTMTARRQALSAAQVAEASARAAEALLALPEVAEARVVSLYMAMPAHAEIDCARAIARLQAGGVTVALPRVVGRGRPLALHAALPGAPLVVSSFGIAEPSDRAPVVPLETVDVFVVPALAYDESGHRVGFGAGHYDATLAAAPRALRVGYAYEFQVVAALPAGPADQRVDVIVTDQGARRTGARALHHPTARVER